MTEHRRCWCGGGVDTMPGPEIGTLGYVCRDSEFHDPLSTGRPEKVDRLYVAGPMSGYPENNYPAFHDATDRLRDAGFAVVNPAEYGDPAGVRVHYVDLLRADLKEMLTCQGVALMDYWWESVGARNEVQVAGLLKMPCRSVSEWMARGPDWKDN